MVLEPGHDVATTQALIEQLHKAPSLSGVPVILYARDELQQANQDIHTNGPLFRLRPDAPGQSLSSVIAAAQMTYRQQENLLAELDSRESAIGLIVSGTFRLRTLSEAEHLTTMLAIACPDRRLASFVLLELLVNAIEHGNLGIGHGEKSQLLMKGVWHEEIARRLNLPENADKYVTVTFERHPELIVIQVEDEGNGFDWRAHMTNDPTSTKQHGRGIALAAGLEGAHLTYDREGRRAILTLDTE
jgi:signal transduction histidine kinase